MKKSVLTIITVVLVAVTTVFAQKEETRTLSSFSKINAQEGIRVYANKGSQESARVVSDVALEKVITEVSGSSLNIYLKKSPLRIEKKVEVYVTFVHLEALSASSVASLKVQDTIVASGDFEVAVSSAGVIEANLQAKILEVKASSAGKVKLEVNVSKIDAKASSAGNVEISGSVKTQTVQVSSSARYKAFDLTSDEVNVKANSGGSIKVAVNNKIEAKANSGGSIHYKGSPQYVQRDTHSGGSVKEY